VLRNLLGVVTRHLFTPLPFVCMYPRRRRMVHLIIICVLILSAIPLLLLYIEDVEVTLSIKHKALGRDTRANDGRLKSLDFGVKPRSDSKDVIGRLNRDFENRHSFSLDDSFIQDEKPLFERLVNETKSRQGLARLHAKLNMRM